MRPLVSFLLAALLLLPNAGCRGLFGSDDDEAPDFEFLNTEWNLEAFRDADGKDSNVGSQGTRLMFLEGDRAEGLVYYTNGGGVVTTYTAIYELGPDGFLAMSHPNYADVITNMPADTRWVEFHSGLANATAYEIEGDELRIIHDGIQALIFKGTR